MCSQRTPDTIRDLLIFLLNELNRLTKITQGSANVSFAYDNASQLTGLTYKKGTTTLGNLTYAYDPAGRRTTLNGTLAKVTLPTAMTSATYNAANQLTAWGSTTFTYDNNGNMTKEGAKAYTWDTRNRLSKTSLGTGTYTYDALNRRSKKVLSGATRQYVYDGNNLVQERNGTNGITANLLTGMGIDETFRRSEGTTSRDFITDALGSTLALTDSTGTALNTQYTYEPYGKTTTTGTANSNTLQYTGRENDAGSGLYFYRNRYYHPTYGRFISRDPIGFGGGDANLYRYVFNNPLSYTDPTGHIAPIIWYVIVSSGIGATAGGVGNYIVQDVTQDGCNETNWGKVANAAAWGGIGGAFLPAFGTTVAGAATIGALANTGQYVSGQLIEGSSISGSGLVASGITGFAGGAIGGGFARPITYGTVGTALPQAAQNAAIGATISANTAVGTLTRNGLGGVVGNLEP